MSRTSPMRLALAAVALVIAPPAWAQSAAIGLKVDRVYSNGSYIHALLRVTNQTDRSINEARIECSVFDIQKQALGIGKDFPEHIAAGQTVVSEILVRSPPDSPATGLTADCRIISIK